MFGIKLLFGDERNKDILANFLSAVLEMPVKEFSDIQILDTVLKKEYEDDKLAVLDVNLKIKSGMMINIEIQILNKKDFERRTVYYTCRRLVDQLSEGDPYTRLNTTVSINIMDFDLFSYKKYHSIYRFMEETEGTHLTDVVRIDFLELQKARESKEDIKRLWMDFLNSETEEELKMLAQKNAVFEKPAAEVIRLSGDAAVRFEYEARQKALRDKMAEIAYGEERGMAKGLAKGLEEGLAKGLAKGREEGLADGFAKGEHTGITLVAKNMKESGVPLPQIAQYTGLSQEEIEKL